MSRTKGNRFPLSFTQTPAVAGALALAAAFICTPVGEARAEECLLDSNDDDIATAGVDTDGGAAGTGADSLACGPDTEASGDGSVAVGSDGDGDGNGTTAGGGLSTAVGADAVASGDLSTAVGAFSSATAPGSTALGSGATATLPNEFVLGTSGNTYTAPGITSRLSKIRQSGPLELVTTDAAGHLASDGGAVFEAVGEVQAGVALALALESPDLAPTESFAVRAGYGNFEGDSHAFGLSAIGSLTAAGQRWTWDAGFGAGWADFAGRDSEATWGGRAGLQWAW
ncbi:MAG: hypothetical protein ACLFWF_13245 [Alphaproteobacteria bacterium]